MLLALAVVVLVVIVSVGALRAHGTDAFNRWVGWATVAAVPLAALGILLLIWEKISRKVDKKPSSSPSPSERRSDTTGDDVVEDAGAGEAVDATYEDMYRRPVQSGWREYMQQVHDITPREGLIGRDDELSRMAAFCAGNQPYWWWRADAWTGKSAIMSWFALHPPPGVTPVSFFVTARYVSQDDSTAFVTAVLGQLEELTGDIHPAPSGQDAHRRLLLLLNQATQLFAARGQQLILVVDGLDEDTGIDAGLPSIASLLPKHCEDGLKVIIASRPNPPIPADVAPDHPLREPAYVHVLGRSEHAQVIRETAELELRKLLTGPKSQRDLLGLVTSAGGGLTRSDLEELTGLAPFEVSETLRGVTGRTFTIRAGGWRTSADETSRVYLMAHETLQAQAVASLGERQLSIYRDQLHRWAESYRMAGWPARTPVYLLRGYFRMLRASRDAARLITCATDAARHDRMLSISGGDAASLIEIATAQEFILTLEDLDLVAMARLALHRDDIVARNHYIPSLLPIIWVLLGDPDRAENLAQSLGDVVEQSRALAAISGALARAGMLQRADKMARSVIDPVKRAESLAIVVRGVAAAGLNQWAEATAEAAEKAAMATTDPAQRAHAMKAVAGALARAGLFSQAERVASLVEAPARRSEALAVIAGALARAGLLDKAEEAAESAQTAARTAPNIGPRADALIILLETVADAGMSQRAASVATAAEAVANTVTDPSQRVRILGDFARALRAAGMNERAECSANASTEAALTIVDTGRRAEMLAASAGALAFVGLHEQAENSAEAARETAQALNDAGAGRRSEALAAVARALARGGLHEQAESVAGSVGIPARQAEALAAVARAQAEAGLRDRAAVTAAAAATAARSVMDHIWRAHVQTVIVGELLRGGLHEQAESVRRLGGHPRSPGRSTRRCSEGSSRGRPAR